ncbi:MAG: DNA-directed RNA polymerase [Candidatus Altiarchaeota archaeon]|nr:DNA-directed RNA polymerase [Candidatus Altiarchaeota archaeon]
MYKLALVRDTVRVPPKRFSEELNTVIVQELDSMITGRIEKNIGVVLSVTDVKEVSEGKIILGDGAIYYDTTFEVLTYMPTIHEVVEGHVTEVTEFGVFVNFGPIDGLIHVSQIAEDFMTYDQKNSMLVGKESNKILKVGDVVRARIVTVSLKNRVSESKIGLTMRQPYLGKIEWIEDDKRRQAEGKKVDKPPEKGKEKKKGSKKE